jgi:putative copper resistance protein D
MLGLDPLPGRWPYPGRALLMLLSTPFHAVLGLTIMQTRTLIGGGWYQSLHLSWVDPAADQVLGGGILWAGGEIVSVTMLGVLVAQWMRHADREARQVDRRLDLAAAAARRAARAAGTVAATAPAPAAPTATPPAATAPAGTAPAGTAQPADDLWQVPWWETDRPGTA